jgi:hypothetical protein
VKNFDVKEIAWEQNLMILWDLESVLKGINNTSTTNSILHITLMLKIDWNWEGKKFNFSGSWDTVELKLMRELTLRQSNQDRDSQLLLSVADLKAHWRK